MSDFTQFMEIFLPQVMADWSQPGLAASFVQGKTVLHKCLGRGHLDRELRIDTDTVFAIGSCAKPFASLSVAFLVDDGALALEQKVVDVLPWFKLSDTKATADVTIRDLLCNRLGLVSSEKRHRQVARDRRDLLMRMRDQPFRHPFRGQYGYCTDAFTVIGEVVEAVTGESWEAFIQRKLWQPLGMRLTNADHKKAQKAGNFASPHIRLDGALKPVPWIYEDHVAVPAGGVNSCISDLSRWLQFLLDGGVWDGKRLISRELMDEIKCPHTPETGEYADHEFSKVVGGGRGAIENESYALGWYVHTYKGMNVFYHTGAIDGFRAITGFVPDIGFGAVVLANSANGYLPRMIFQTALDVCVTGESQDWSTRFRTFEESDSSLTSKAEVRHAPFSAGREGEIRSGRYIDQTGFGPAAVSRESGQLVLKVGMLTFDLFVKGREDFLAYKRWPYPGPPHFVGHARFDDAGKYKGFSTDQEAFFEYLEA